MDQTPALWTPTDPAGADFDVYKESQKPYSSSDEVSARQKREMESGGSGKGAKFTKYDMVNVVARHGFRAPAEVINWAKSSAGAAAKRYIVNNTRVLRNIIQDAEQWMDPSSTQDHLDVSRQAKVPL